MFARPGGQLQKERNASGELGITAQTRQHAGGGRHSIKTVVIASLLSTFRSALSGAKSAHLASAFNRMPAESASEVEQI
jgi:hypothetical protein